MLPHKHFVYGIVFSLILAIIMPQIGFTGVLLIILSTVALDADHYIYYIYKKQDLSLIHAYKFFRNIRKKVLSLPYKKRDEYHGPWCFLHGLEVLVILFFLTIFVSDYIGFVFIGVAFHLLLDYIEQWPLSKRKDRISSAYDFLKFRKLRDINEI